MKAAKVKKEKKTKKGFTGLTNNKGFTMIELAIVLVIIGLILGSVLKGQGYDQLCQTEAFLQQLYKGLEIERGVIP